MSSSPIPSPPPDASVSQRGLISTGTQSFAGAKTFTAILASSVASGSNAFSLLDGARLNLSTGDTSAYLYRSAANIIRTPGSLTVDTTLNFNLVTVNGAAGAAGEVLTSAGAGLPPTWAVAGGGHSPVTLTAVGAAPNANGASLATQALTLQPADGSNPGLLTAGTQTIGGAKTFSAAISASNLSGTNTGDITLTAVGAAPNANGASLSGQALTLQPASGSQPGVLTTGSQTIAGAKTLTSKLTFSGLATGTTVFENSTADLTTAKAFFFNNTITLGTGNAMLAEFQNNGTKMLALTYWGRLEVEDLYYITGGWRVYGASPSLFAVYIPGGAAALSINAGTGQVTHAYGTLSDFYSTYTAVPVTLQGTQVDGASAIGVIANSGVTLANATAKLLSVQNNSTEKLYIDKDGNITIVGTSGGTVKGGTSSILTLNNATGAQLEQGGSRLLLDSAGADLRGNVANGAGAVGVVLGSLPTYSTAGAKLLSIKNNTTEKVAVDRDGVISTVGHTHVRATTNTGSLTGGTPSTVVFGTEVTDTLSEYNAGTGVFTAAKDGTYLVSAMVITDGGSSLTAGDNFEIYIYKNGTTVAALGSYSFAESSMSGPMSSNVSTTLTLSAGDTLEIQAAANGYSPNLTAQHYANYFTIDRLI